jgi:hypothetical protein
MPVIRGGHRRAILPDMKETDDMTNEKISYRDFAKRFAPFLWTSLTQAQRDDALRIAWEECAFINTLTDKRGVEALNHAIQLVWTPPKRP